MFHDMLIVVNFLMT